jgi:hypothetical protein
VALSIVPNGQVALAVNKAPATTTVTAQPANGAAAQVNWTTTAPAAGWYVQTYDNATGYVGATWCFACSSARVANLTPGRTYVWLVYPMGTTSSSGPGPILAGPSQSNTVTVGPDAVPDPLTNFSLTVAPADETATVTWRPATTGQAADSVTLLTFAKPGPTALQPLVVPASAGRKTIPFLPGQFAIMAYATNSAGSSSPVATNWFAVNTNCATADVCVHVRAGATQGPEQLVAQGFLHSVPTVSVAAIAALLRPAQWRLGAQTQAAGVAAYKPVETQIISDHWATDSGVNRAGFAITPWSNWSAFSSYVTRLVQSAEAGGWAPTYWDLFNEPDGLLQGSLYLSPQDQATVTTDNLLQMLAVEYRAVKAADPNAKVVAPSLVLFSDQPSGQRGQLDLATFLRYAAASGLKLDAISWHENLDFGATGDWGASSAPYNIADHVARARQLVAQNPGAGNPVILINEYGTPQTHTLPSWQVGMFAALERAGVAGASRSCWANECGPPVMDGLLGWNGTAWTATLPAYWTAKAYGDMSASTRVATDSTASWRLDGLSVRQDSASTVRVLIGHHWGCAQAHNPWCSSPGSIPAVSTNVTIDWPYSSPAALVTVNLIAAGPSALAAPASVWARRTLVSGGTLTFSLPAVADGDAYSIVATASP